MSRATRIAFRRFGVEIRVRGYGVSFWPPRWLTPSVLTITDICASLDQIDWAARRAEFEAVHAERRCEIERKLLEHFRAANPEWYGPRADSSATALTRGPMHAFTVPRVLFEEYEVFGPSVLIAKGDIARPHFMFKGVCCFCEDLP